MDEKSKRFDILKLKKFRILILKAGRSPGLYSVAKIASDIYSYIFVNLNMKEAVENSKLLLPYCCIVATTTVQRRDFDVLREFKAEGIRLHLSTRIIFQI